MRTTTKSCRLLARRILVLMLYGLTVFGAGWSIRPTMRAQTIPPPPTATPSPPTPVSSGHLSITKRDFLFSDVDNDDRVSPGDTLFYAITVVNDGAGATPQLRLEDRPDPNTRLVISSVKVIGGVIVQGNQTGNDQVIVEITPLISGAHASLSFQVVVNDQINVTQLQNQALVTMLNPDGQPSGPAPLGSDDPDTAALNDATITPLTEPVEQLSPALFLPLIYKAQP